jgi:hypothetical protein
MSKIFVIAGNRAEADQWIKGNLEKRKNEGVTTLSWSDYVVVKDVTNLYGYRNPSGFFIGTWKQRKDLEGIFQALLTATDITSNRHRVLNQMWGEWADANPKPKPKHLNGTWSERVKEAADDLAKEIDRELLRTLTTSGDMKIGQNYTSVTYDEFVPTFIKAIQELKNEVDELKHATNTTNSTGSGV